MIRKILFACLVLMTIPLHASPNRGGSLDVYVEKAISEQLFKRATWQKLLVYESGGWLKSNLQSAILSDSFFFAPDGRTNPESELIATLQEMAKPSSESSDSHAQCKFPARYLWLKDQLEIPIELMPEIHCSDFTDWSLGGEVDSLSVIFASGYLGNPASYYGHTLLKLNSKNKDRTRLLDVSVNFGAIVPEDEDPVSYIIKGLFGGYNAGFSQTEYYFHNQSYGEIELRDLWEYELDLSAKDVRMILAHTWEVMGKEYRYFFLNENCSYRMGELLEVIDGVKVNPDNNLWVIPQAQILQLGHAQFMGRPLIRKIDFQPSRQSRLYARFSKLESHQKRLVSNAISDTSLLDAPSFSTEPLESQYLILDTMLDYYQFADKVFDDGAESREKSYQKVLATRYQLPPGESQKLRVEATSPDEGRNPSLVQVGVSHSSELGDGLLVNIRPAYYDGLDSGAEHIKYAELIMGQLRLSVFNHKTILSGLDFVSIQSLNTDTTGLPGDSNESWRLKAGLQSVRAGCSSACLVMQFEGDKGYAFKLSNNVVLGGYIGGAVRENRHGYGNFEGRVTGSAIVNFTQKIRTRFEYQYKEQLDGKRLSQNSYRFDARYHLDRNWDVRFNYENAEAEQYSLLLGYYW